MASPSNYFFLQFDGFIDLDGYDTIALKLKGDGRCYISTVSSCVLSLFGCLHASDAHVFNELLLLIFG